jgi:hypothetical protein
MRGARLPKGLPPPAARAPATRVARKDFHDARA